MENTDVLFEYESYEQFRSARLKLNIENTLKLWYSLPTDLNNIDNAFFRQQTSRQQRARMRNLKCFAFYSMILKKTCLKKQIRSKGFNLWNDTLNIPSLKDESLYDVYQSLGHITVDFLRQGERYDSTIAYEELFKAGRTVWFMIAFQMQLNLPLTLTDSIFGYNMLYPYTDDFIDSNQISQEAKKEFAQLFHQRLLVGQFDYNPNEHFNGSQQSHVDDLHLSPSLQIHGQTIGKIFDMVKFIENDWKRNEYPGVYMSLATIHESQMKSTLQHVHVNDSDEPTMERIEQISADKGGASLIAAGFLIKGRLTRNRMGYLEYLGFALQLLDDLQDFNEDMTNNHRTIFTQSVIQGKTLDEPTARLIQYCYCSPAYQIFDDDQKTTISDEDNDQTLARYVRVSMMMFSVVLVLEAASKLKEFYSNEFYQQLSTLSPIPFQELRTTMIEQKIWAIVRNQWF